MIDQIVTVLVGAAAITTIWYYGRVIYRWFQPLKIEFLVEGDYRSKLHDLDSETDPKPWNPGPSIPVGVIVITNKSGEHIEIGSVEVCGSTGEVKPAFLTRPARSGTKDHKSAIGPEESAAYTLDLIKSESDFVPDYASVRDFSGRIWKRSSKMSHPGSRLPR